MVYSPLTNKAMQIAYTAHHGQVDKGGLPYIFHPYHLAEQMEDEVSCCAALLHDVAEDTDITLEDLAKEFPSAVMEVLTLLTHKEDVPYYEYVRAVKANPIAVKIKLADIAHNSDQSRCPNLTPEQLAYFRDKYARAIAILTEGD